ncbi:MAG: VanZ family protein [Candidatus Omnitrophota bacterium]|nr:VanZ family protein [Candidatus Omnitrophota bacterium]
MSDEVRGLNKASCLIAWFPVLFFMAVIFRASATPGKDIPPLFPFQDIAWHFGIYLIMAYFFSRALRSTWGRMSVKKILLFTLAFAVFYGITDELHQLFTPGRSATGFDVLIDSLGGLTGGLIYKWLL